jgi:hypothetical protein
MGTVSFGKLANLIIGAQMQHKFEWLVGRGESFLDVAIDGFMAVMGALLLTQLLRMTFGAL